MNQLKRWLSKPTEEMVPITDPFHLDKPLLYLSPSDAWTIRDACEGVQIFGAIGSGKTSGSGAAIAKAFLRQGFGGLVLCAKPEERDTWVTYARETQREKDVVVISPEEKWRFNFLDYELRREGGGGGQTENLVNLFAIITDIVEGKQEVGGGDRFWDRAMRELLRNAIDLLAIAHGTLSLEMIVDVITSAPQSTDQVADPNWQQHAFCAQSIRYAEQHAHTKRQRHDFDMAARYWLQTYPALGDRTRSSIVATFTSIADMLLHGIAWELFCTETNIVPEVTYRNGTIIILDIPIQEYDQLGRIAQGIFKTMFQRAILRRDPNRFSRPVFLWADEAQNFVSSFDYKYQAVARSARACTVYLTQNISNYYSVLGAHGRDQANALLGNFQTKIFHANSGETNQFAADLISQHHVISHNFNTSQTQSSSTRSSGGSDQLQYKVLPAAFTTLRKGGPLNQLEVDAIVFQGGRVWQATGDTWLPAVFKQGQL